jgi:hypothetical protein
MALSRSPLSGLDSTDGAGVFGHTATRVGDDVYIFGGVSSAGGRKDSMTRLVVKAGGGEGDQAGTSASQSALDPPPTPLFVGRAWHSTAYSPSTNSLVSFGGRTNPCDPRSDVIAYDVAASEWFAPQQDGEGVARYRHSMTMLDTGPEGADSYLILGGSDGSSAISRPQIMVVSKQQGGGGGEGQGPVRCTWMDAEFEGVDLPPEAR